MYDNNTELVSKRTKNTFYIAIITFTIGIFFPVLLLISLPAIVIFIVLFTIDAIKVHSNTAGSDEINVFKSYFLGLEELRKKDGNVNRGDCEIEFKDDKFYIKQDDQFITNDISSIYYFGIWEYKEDTYFKFRMRSGTEYKFCSQHFEADKIPNLMQKYNISIEDDRE